MIESSISSSSCNEMTIKLAYMYSMTVAYFSYRAINLLRDGNCTVPQRYSLTDIFPVYGSYSLSKCRIAYLSFSTTLFAGILNIHLNSSFFDCGGSIDLTNCSTLISTTILLTLVFCCNASQFSNTCSLLSM